MKILYVKANSERAKEFQLRTIVFEENGQKFVKKQTMCDEAIPHLKKMKDSYEKLTASIMNSNIKLAKIIEETENSLTFEFIDGTSLESKYNLAKKQSDAAVDKVITEYMELVRSGFKTTHFDSNTMVTDEFKKMFGDLDYSEFDGQPCFDDISNIDLIFSNIIFKDNSIYLIDYEWILNFNVPIAFSVFRTLHEDNDLHWQMEKHFVFSNVVNTHGFLKVQDNYQKIRLNLEKHIQGLESAIHDKDVHIKTQNVTLKTIIHNKDVHIENQDEIISQNASDIKKQAKEIAHLHDILQSMRIKSRIKRFVPESLWQSLKKVKQIVKPVDQDLITQDEIEIEKNVNTYVYKNPIWDDNISNEIASFKHKPLISIIMPVYNVAPKWLDLAIKSIEEQWYVNWELCIADDKSTKQETIEYLKNIDHSKIKITFLEENINISGSSNAALALTSGEYIALMDNDDEITPDALYEVVKAINSQGAEFIYSDEDKIEMDGSFSDPNFKPDFAPDMFLSQNYLSHLGVIKKDLISKVDGFTVGLEGSQDFDLYLKVLEHTDKIYHIEKILYHWRKIPGSTAAEYGDKSYAQDAGKKALENAMARRNTKATVKNGQTPGTYKVDYEIIDYPLISIVIPFKDKPELLKACVESILVKSTYENFEIIGISNNSEEEETQNEMDRLKTLDERISFYEYNVEFNYSKINNYAVNNYAQGEHIIFLNNDIEIISPTWIEEMLMYSQQAHNGAIGAKLYFPNKTIQHAGIVLAPKTIHSAILLYQGFPKYHSGYGARLKCVNNYSAVTAACLMLKKDLFTKIGGFDEDKLSIAYNDVDLCLTLQEAGYKNIWTPYSEAYHHESISRGHEVNVKDVERREKEKWHLKNKHPDIFSHTDPFYNKRLTRFGVGSELDDSVTIHHEAVNGIPFYEEIIFSKKIRSKKNDKVCIFNHFDTQNEIKEDVIYYIKELSKFTDIIFVSTAEGLGEMALNKIEGYCKDVLVKKNVGYDFGAWKTGIDYLGTDIDQYEQLILCNDSVYGPLFDLENIFNEMSAYDLWSMTDNHEIEYHLQSYFMVYNKKAFTHSIFQDFWKNLKIYHNKQMLIENNELGFSQAMMQTDLSYSSYYIAKNNNYVNVLQYYWDDLLRDNKFPFIKKELIKRNPLNIKIDNWSDVIESVSDYDTNLITNTLSH